MIMLDGVYLPNDVSQVKVEVLCYCFMPTHFHLLIKQVKDGGIVEFMSKTKNSFRDHFSRRNSMQFILTTRSYFYTYQDISI